MTVEQQGVSNEGNEVQFLDWLAEEPTEVGHVSDARRDGLMSSVDPLTAAVWLTAATVLVCGVWLVNAGWCLFRSLV
jgi:hypothetical protein